MSKNPYQAKEQYTLEQRTLRTGSVVLFARPDVKPWYARYRKNDGKWQTFSTGKVEFKDAKTVAKETYDEYRFAKKLGVPTGNKPFDLAAKEAILEMLAKKGCPTKYKEKWEKKIGRQVTERMKDLYGGKNWQVIYKHYISAIYNYCIPYFKKKNIENIEKPDIDLFSNWRAAEMQKKSNSMDGSRRKPSDGPPSKSTLSNHNAALRRVFAKAVEKKWIKEHEIPTIKNDGEDAKPRAWFTTSQYNSLIQHSRYNWEKETNKKKQEIKYLLHQEIIFIRNTGIRTPSEVENIKWKDIWEVRGNDGEFYIHIKIKGVKGKKDREIVADELARKALERLRDRFEDLKNRPFNELKKEKVGEYVFVLPNGKFPYDLNYYFMQLLDKAGLSSKMKDDEKEQEEYSMYSLRHTYCTNQLLQGRDIYLLSLQMGNSTDTIKKFYSKLQPSMNQELFGGHRPNPSNPYIDEYGKILLSDHLLKRIKYDCPEGTEFDLSIGENKELILKPI